MWMPPPVTAPNVTPEEIAAVPLRMSRQSPPPLAVSVMFLMMNAACNSDPRAMLCVRHVTAAFAVVVVIVSLFASSTTEPPPVTGAAREKLLHDCPDARLRVRVNPFVSMLLTRGLTAAKVLNAPVPDDSPL